MLEQGISPMEVSQVTRFGLSTVYRVWKLWLATGSVVKQNLELGRPRALASLEVQVVTVLTSNYMSSTTDKYWELYWATARHLC